MNYYERHLGDYLKDTISLSMLEEGAYTRLLDYYYSKEHGIPADKAHKIARAGSKAECAAVDAVLQEFFKLNDGVWTKNRCEEEIERFQVGIPAAEEKKENDKDRQRRARDRRKAMFSELASHGVVMPWNTRTSELQTELSRVLSQPSHAPVTPPVTRDNTASSLQSPVSSQIPVGGEAPPGTLATQIYRLARQIGVSPGVITNEIKAHSETEVWEALGSTLSAKPAEPLPYFRGCLKKNGETRFKSA